jgi:GTPase SAR1 family protein
MRAKENPFAVHRVSQFRYQWSEAKWCSAIMQLESISYQGAIVGPHGCGKTTLLEDLIDRLRSRGQQTFFFQLHTGERRLPLAVESQFTNLPPKTIALLDGAEQLSSWRWRQLANYFRRSGRPFIVTLHQAGRWPIWFQCKSDLAILNQMVDELLQGAVADCDETNRHLYAKHQGNIRDALREWYDLMAKSPTALTEHASEVATLNNRRRLSIITMSETA